MFTAAYVGPYMFTYTAKRIRINLFGALSELESCLHSDQVEL